MPPKQPKKGKGKKVTVTDPTSAPAPAPAAPPNPEVQPVVDAHIANVGSEHFPGGYFPIPYTLTSPDAESFPQLPPLREPLEAALFGKWDQPGNPHSSMYMATTAVCILMSPPRRGARSSQTFRRHQVSSPSGSAVPCSASTTCSGQHQIYPWACTWPQVQ